MLRVENPAVVHALALLIGEVVEVATTAATAVKIVAGAQPTQPPRLPDQRSYLARLCSKKRQVGVQCKDASFG